MINEERCEVRRKAMQNDKFAPRRKLMKTDEKRFASSQSTKCKYYLHLHAGGVKSSANDEHDDKDAGARGAKTWLW